MGRVSPVGSHSVAAPRRTSRRIVVSEIFGPTVQGEGALIGRPTVFVRTGGCDYRCTWCDSLFAVLPEHRSRWTRLLPEEVLTEILLLTDGSPVLVTLSGGNPALQPLEEIVELGRERGLTFALETQGSVSKPWFHRLDHLALSPKPPSSGYVTSVEDVATCLREAGEGPETYLKVVVFDEFDYAYARQMATAFPSVPFYLQVGNRFPSAGENEIDVVGLHDQFEWLVRRVAADRWFDVRVLPQLHVLVWGNRRGV